MKNTVALTRKGNISSPCKPLTSSEAILIMKRFLLPFIALTFCAPAYAESRSFEISQLPPLPAATSSKQSSSSEWFWLKAAQPTKLATLASQLGIPVTDLAKANETLTNHTFRKGEWIRLPVSVSEAALNIVGLDADTLTTSAPLAPPPPVSDMAAFKRGDSLASFLKRHGLTAEQLKEYNPGLDLTRLSVGRELRVAKAAGGQRLLAIRPTVTGGAKWPERPSLPVRESSRARAVRARIQSNRNYAASSYAKRWRQYALLVDWQGWKLHSNGVRSTTVIHSVVEAVAVSCKATTYSHKRKGYPGWGAWNLPTRNSLDEKMIIDLCSNVTGG